MPPSRPERLRALSVFVLVLNAPFPTPGRSGDLLDEWLPNLPLGANVDFYASTIPLCGLEGGSTDRWRSLSYAGSWDLWRAQRFVLQSVLRLVRCLVLVPLQLWPYGLGPGGQVEFRFPPTRV